MKPVLEIQWIYIFIGGVIGVLMTLNGYYRVRKCRQTQAVAAKETPPSLEEKAKPKTLKEKRNAWKSPELRIAHRILTNGLALILGCIFLALGKITGF